MKNYSQQQKKTFSPLILFNDYPYASSTQEKDNQNLSYRQSLLEKHTEETKKRLEINARLWEDKRRQSLDHPPLPVHANPLMPPISPVQTAVGPFTEYKNIMYTPSPTDVISQNTSETKQNTQYQTIILDADRYGQQVSKENTKNAYTTTNFPFISEHQHCTSYESFLNRKRRRENLPKEATEYLKRWLIHHKKHPYPTEREKKQLADETNLAVGQISNWFINARRRILQPILQSENSEQQQDDEEQWQRSSYPDTQRYSPSINPSSSSYSENTAQPDPFTSSNHKELA